MISLTCAISEYEHVRDLDSGRVRAEGIDLRIISMPVEEIFYRAIRHREFDISEMSMGRFASLVSTGNCPFVAIPVFPSRAFRHSAIYVRSKDKARAPKDLRGGRIGIPEWAQTAGIYVRGMFADRYGLLPTEVEWVQGGLEQPDREEEVPIQLPPDVKLSRAGARTLNDLLLAGELNAVISAHPPIAFKHGDGAIRTLFESGGDEERRYWKETGVFPIMHVLVIRDDLFRAHRWIAMNLLHAFTEAKDRSLARAREITASRFPFPLMNEFVRGTVADFGVDYWPYGIERNRETLSTFLLHAHQQGVTGRRLSIDDLFPAEVRTSFKV